MRPVIEDEATQDTSSPCESQDVTAIYARYARPLYRFILRRVGEATVAEDLLQDVFVRMLAGLPQYEDRGYPIGAWLYRIAACRVTDWRRTSGRRATIQLHQAEELAGEACLDGEATAADREALQRVLGATLTQLTAPQATVIRLRFLTDLSTIEVAARLGLTPQAVKALQHRGLAQLRRHLTYLSPYHAA
jgi:RNA polymerase sigma-70 factor (ECF subfamily)